MRLLVTGGSGYLGSELVPRARAAGIQVLAPRHAEVDVREADAVRRAVSGCDAVLHAAYVQDGPEARATIVDGSANVARAAREAGARLVHLSTDLIFDGASDGAYVEEDEPRPAILYGEAKAEAERAVGREALVVRTSLLYGGAEPGRNERVVLDALDGADFTFFTNELRSVTHVADLAGALLELLALDVRGPLHVAGTDAVDRLTFARLLARSQGRDPGALRGAPSPGGRPLNCSLDSSRARAILRTRLRGAREVLG